MWGWFPLKSQCFRTEDQSEGAKWFMFNNVLTPDEQEEYRRLVRRAYWLSH